jgi:hypothetical protein
MRNSHDFSIPGARNTQNLVDNDIVLGTAFERQWDLRAMTGTFRAAEREDLRALSEFLVRVYKFESSDFHFNPQLLEWKYLYPRAGWQGSRSYLMEKDGKIVAHAGACPVSFRRPDGHIVNSLTIMDWGADSSIPLVGVTLFRKLMAMAPTTFVIGGAPATRQILPRLGFRQAAEAPTYSAWLRPWHEFRTRPRTGRSVLRLLHGLTHPVRRPSRPIGNWEFVAIPEFDNSLQPMLDGLKRPWTFCQRTVADLNYLLRCPHLEVRGFLLKRGGNLAGYFVMGKSAWEARLLDLMVDSDDPDDWKDAYAAATSAASLDHDLCRIRVLSTVPMLSQALEQNGYWCQYEDPIMIHDPGAALGGAFPVSVQLFDGDAGY